MRILIVNDDGVNTAQLPNLIRWCRKLGEVTAVAPKFEQSGKSHGIELHRPIEAKQVALAPDVTAWALDSTPADCVRFGVLALNQTYDLVISGVNKGLNVGVDMMYSGTVGAACEAVNLGLKAIALSTTPGNYPNATRELDRIFDFIRENHLLERHNLYNINIPTGEPQGIRFTRMGGPYYSDRFVPIGSDLYNPEGYTIWRDSGDDNLDTDATLRGKYITITPLTVNRTDNAVFEELTKMNP
ncbi:MAG: 5'/3'-nucleotidase SurE [Oscillospiraceae bacterium]|nr:5'/3'-nucleotidase SurE [Oscillospiraceae bacterium]